MSEETTPSLRVGAHVLVQLGSELVTDAEQAILECVKNAYDADSPTCRIIVQTSETGVRVETGTAGRLVRFRKPTDTVSVEMLGPDGEVLADDVVVSGPASPDPVPALPGPASGSPPPSLGEEDAPVAEATTDEVPVLKPDDPVTRKLTYTGRVTIEDNGDGLTREQLRSSWLVVSGSAKRVQTGQKKKTNRLLRTPLGDKGLGRLGSMRLGDILLVESATDEGGPVETAQFRWADCSVAATVDEIPVFLETLPNAKGFKGTRVSVLGLRDMEEWKLRRSTDKLRRGLTRLISPFEAKATFKVSLGIDGPEQSLAAVTDDVLNKAVAKFTFDWEREPDTGVLYLVSTASFRKRLLTPERKGAAQEKASIALKPDNGAGFANFLPGFNRTKKFKPEADPNGAWYIVMSSRTPWVDLIMKGAESVADPGPFAGAIYYFHLDGLGNEAVETQAGQPTDRALIREMAGITILRDGFQVRSQGDWLDLASGMTSGSTYQLRPNNTVGYFDLSGEHNFSLVEKSDREGFVENAAYRGFMRVAMTCKEFANDTLEGVRRAFDKYYERLIEERGNEKPLTTARSMAVVERTQARAQEVRSLADDAARNIAAEISALEREGPNAAPVARRALQVARSAFTAVEAVRKGLSGDDESRLAVMRLKHELELNREQISALFESAAVGMSARGLAHELRTHLDEIVSRAGVLEKAARKAGADAAMLPSLRAIRGACTEIRKAAALIDPMLPRSRTVRETFPLAAFVRDYVSRRASTFEREGIKFDVIDEGAPNVRTNRSRLTQVIDNLVRNAAFWLVRGKQTTGIERERTITIEVGPSGFVVSDTGPGVDPMYEDALFEIFVTAKGPDEQGQGLGLYIVRNLLQAEGCDIDLLPDRNPEGRRYRFAVNLKNIVVAG